MKLLRSLGVAVVAVGSFVMSSSALAVGTLDLSLSDKIIRVGFDTIRQDTPAHFSASWLHDSDKGEVGTLGFHVVERQPRLQNLYLGVGAVAHYVNIDRLDKNTGAIAIGGFFRYALPQMEDVSIAGNFYYAPQVLSFSDAKSLMNTDWRLQYSLIPSARVFLGYRYVSVRMDRDYAKRTHRVGDGLHIGFSLDF